MSGGVTRCRGGVSAKKRTRRAVVSPREHERFLFGVISQAIGQRAVINVNVALWKHHILVIKVKIAGEEGEADDLWPDGRDAENEMLPLVCSTRVTNSP